MMEIEVQCGCSDDDNDDASYAMLCSPLDPLLHD